MASVICFLVLNAVADALGFGAVMRWWDRRRRARFERKLARLLPPRPPPVS
ncbi:MAG: hypothetical protein H0T42_11070 [Deltaproteobacteria bacterium]|nr:hypothetical protein [Deltaproteobacteria bacterium]